MIGNPPDADSQDTPAPDGPCHDGGCFCGAVRYRITGAPIDVGYCHCSMCRRLHGAPVVAWATVAPAAFRFITGVPRRFRSSAPAQRLFCGDCGTPLLFRPDPQPADGFIDVAVATLDAPDRMLPEYHIWTDNRLAWFETADTLPRHAGNGPDRRA